MQEKEGGGGGGDVKEKQEEEEEEVVEGASRWRRVQAGVGICSAPTREYVRYYRREETEKETSNVREEKRERKG